MPRKSVVRACLFAGGVVVLFIAGKVAFAGLGAGTFKVTTRELVLLVVVGVALIALGWQRREKSSTEFEEGLSGDIDSEDEP